MEMLPHQNCSNFLQMHMYHIVPPVIQLVLPIARSSLLHGNPNIGNKDSNMLLLQM